MGAYTQTYNFTDGTTAYGSQVAFEIAALGTSVNNIVNAQIASNAAIADSKLAQITTAGKISGAAITSLGSLPSGAGTVPNANILDGHVVQFVGNVDGSVSTGTTTIPYDDYVPQNTEGDQYLSQAITPKATTNILKIEVVAILSTSVSNRAVTAALFQDSTAGALAACSEYFPANMAGVYSRAIKFTHYMLAGTTSETTFKVRAGCEDAGTTTFNGDNGSRIFGDVAASSITITEFKAS